MEKELKVSFELTFSQFRVLNGLLALGEASQRKLASSLEVTPAVVTRQAEVLGSFGLIEQRSNPQSKRENLLRLTRKGEEAAVDAAKLIERKKNQLLEPLSRQDETAFGSMIDTLLAAWDARMRAEADSKKRS